VNGDVVMVIAIEKWKNISASQIANHETDEL
jgi:hypothetical protein